MRLFAWTAAVLLAASPLSAQTVRAAFLYVTG